MSEDVKKEEIIDEGEVVEIESETPEPESEEAEQPQEEVQASAEPQGEDELENYSDRVQKRIKNLTRKLREAERASESAYTYANQLQQENQQLQQKSANLDRSYLSEAENRLKSQKAQAQAALKGAYEEQDFDKVAKAQDIIAKIAVEESKIEASKSQLEYQDEQKAQNNEVNVAQNVISQPQAIPQPAPEPDPKAQSWAENNTWFGEDETMTIAAFNIHRKLVEDEGFDPKSDEYYTEVDKRIREDFPHKFEERKQPSQRVASAGRADTSATPSKKQVRLSPSEVQMAKKLNVPLSEYAKFVKR
tara:strand:+ start:2939 stop:3853 length:915 start_codon:yes stop_codon:yes gene_type:complete